MELLRRDGGQYCRVYLGKRTEALPICSNAVEMRAVTVM